MGSVMELPKSASASRAPALVPVDPVMLPWSAMISRGFKSGQYPSINNFCEREGVSLTLVRSILNSDGSYIAQAPYERKYSAEPVVGIVFALGYRPLLVPSDSVVSFVDGTGEPGDDIHSRAARHVLNWAKAVHKMSLESTDKPIWKAAEECGIEYQRALRSIPRFANGDADSSKPKLVDIVKLTNAYGFRVEFCPYGYDIVLN
jgi:hypothetical protein